jgi:hypothetical protein
MLALAGVAAAGAGASGAFPHAVSSAGARLAPPATLRCDRNQLTSFNGEVTSYERTAEQTRIEITTDWGSVESFTLPHADGRVEQRFLLCADWSQVETAPGQLIDGMQAIIWVCEHPAVTPVVDWRPRNQE